MASETDFLNTALAQAKLPPISDIAELTDNAGRCRTLWPPLRRSILEMYRPGFSIKRAILNASPAPPIFGFAFAYDLPPTYVFLLEYNGDQPDFSNIDPSWRGTPPSWKIEGSQILTNDAIVAIRYVDDVPNPATWSSLFFQYAAAMLAALLIEAAYGDANRAAAKRNEAMNLWMPPMVASDGQQNSTQSLTVDDLTRGR